MSTPPEQDSSVTIINPKEIPQAHDSDDTNVDATNSPVHGVQLMSDIRASMVSDWDDRIGCSDSPSTTTHTRVLLRSHTHGGPRSKPKKFVLVPEPTPTGSPTPKKVPGLRRARSMSPPVRVSIQEISGMQKWLVEKLATVDTRLRTEIATAIREVDKNDKEAAANSKYTSNNVTKSSAATPQNLAFAVAQVGRKPSNSMTSIVVKEKLQEVVTTLLDRPEDEDSKLTPANFQHALDSLQKLLTHNPGQACSLVIQRVMISIAKAARIVECLEFNPNDDEDATANINFSTMSLDNRHLPRYVLEKMTMVFGPDDPNSNISSSNDTLLEIAPSLTAMAKFLEELPEGQMPTKHDFCMQKLISSGAYGSVFLAKHKTTEEQFAIKVLDKKELINKNCVSQVMAEKEVLRFAQNPFVIQFFCSFSTKQSLYIVMEFAPGGDLGTMLKNLGSLTEREARRYFAETVLAVEYIHEFNIIHRDLKPENLVMSISGHVKLTDFGLSKIGFVSRTARFIDSLQSMDWIEGGSDDARSNGTHTNTTATIQQDSSNASHNDGNDRDSNMSTPTKGNGDNPSTSDTNTTAANTSSDSNATLSWSPPSRPKSFLSAFGTPNDHNNGSLLDFGLEKSADEHVTTTIDPGSTDSVGTPDYMAPEVILGSP